jgi:hypothetical protein
MIENYSRCWGGSGDVLIPIGNDDAVAPPLWRALERYDPDRLGYYLLTRRGQQLAAPNAFEQWLDSTARNLADENTPYARARQMLQEDHIMSSPVQPWRPPASLEELAKRRLAPMGRRNAFDDVWVADDTPGRHYVDVANISEARTGSPVSVLRADQIDPRIDLMLTSRVGGASASLRATLGKTVAIIDWSARPSDLGVVLDICWERDRRKLARHRAFTRMVGGDTEESMPSEFLDRTPFSVTEVGCGWFIIGRLATDLPHVVVIGDAAEDFALWMLLDRMYQQAYWCPKAFLAGDDELSDAFRKHLGLRLHTASGLGRGGDDEKVVFTSISLADDELTELFPRISENPWIPDYSSDDSSLSVTTCSADELPLPRPWRLYDPGEILRQSFEPFVGSDMAGTVVTPRPSAISPVSPWDFSWHVDALVDGVQLPPRSCLSPLLAVFGIADADSVRAGSDGVSYFSREPFFIPAGASLDQMTYRPRLRNPGPTDLFEELFVAAGYRAEVSQAGRFSTGMIEAWQGLSSTAEELNDPARVRLFEAFRRRTQSGQDPGVWLTGTKRRYLSFWDIRRVTGAAREDVRSLVDGYVQRGVLTRGWCLKCPRCNYAAWYAHEDVGRSFRCSRCRVESLITASTWRHPSEPMPFYQLDELVFQAVDNDARAPLLALDHLRKETRSFLFAPEMDIYRGEALIAEIDLLAFVEGRILIGEAKTGDRLEDNEQKERAVIQRLKRIADTMTAHEVVFATTSPAWNSTTWRLIREEFRPSQRRILTSL